MAGIQLVRRVVLNPVFLLILLVAAVAAGAVLYQRYQETQKQLQVLSNPQEAARAETKRVIDAVGKLIELPADETPTIATVTDKERLKEQSFFAKSENGDRVLIYTQARRAILYRPSVNKVIEVGQVNISEQTQQQQPKR